MHSINNHRRRAHSIFADSRYRSGEIARAWLLDDALGYMIA